MKAAMRQAPPRIRAGPGVSSPEFDPCHNGPCGESPWVQISRFSPLVVKPTLKVVFPSGTARIALVTPRYGDSVVGGSEAVMREAAQVLPGAATPSRC